MQTATLTSAKVQEMASRWRDRRWANLRWGDLWVLGVVVLLVSGTSAQSPAASEYQVKAAFLYNFAKFVEWPPSSFHDGSAPLQICVLGRDPFGEVLRDITREKTVNGHKLEVRGVVDLQLARACHILFIAFSERTRLKQIFEALQGSYALTVGDAKDFAEQGGMINFVLQDDRVQFEVSRTAVEQSGLKISSKLLAVAKVVIG